MALVSNGVNQYSTHTLTTAHNTTGAFSIAFTFKTGASVTGAVQVPLHINRASGYARGIGLEIGTTGIMRGFSEAGSRGWSASLGTATPNTTYTVVMTRDATATGITTFYINTLSNVSTRSSNIAETLTRIITGAIYSNAYTDYFDGKVGRIAFWTSKLSSADITIALDLAQSPATCSVAPQDYWVAIADDTPSVGTIPTVRLGTVYDTDNFVDPFTQVNTFTSTAEVGGVFNYTTTGFDTLTAITSNQAGIAVNDITGVDGSGVVTGWSNGVSYPELPVGVAWSFTDGTRSVLVNGQITKPANYTRVVSETPVLTNGYLAGDILSQTGRTIVSGDVFYYTTYDDFVLNPDTGYTVTSAGTIDLWVRIAAGIDAGKMYYYEVDINITGNNVAVMDIGTCRVQAESPMFDCDYFSTDRP